MLVVMFAIALIVIGAILLIGPFFMPILILRLDEYERDELEVLAELCALNQRHIGIWFIGSLVGTASVAVGSVLLGKLI